MTIRAPNLAFRDFGPNSGHGSYIANHGANCCSLTAPHVVEVKHAGIRLATINARVLREVAHQFVPARQARRTRPRSYRAMVRLAPDALHVFCTIDPLARLANTMPTTCGLIAKAEVFERFGFTATSTSLHANIVTTRYASTLAS
jgi:hypothetical protein